MFFFPGMSVPSYDVEIDEDGGATYTPQGAPHRMQGHREEWQQKDPEQSPARARRRLQNFSNSCCRPSFPMMRCRIRTTGCTARQQQKPNVPS